MTLQTANKIGIGKGTVVPATSDTATRHAHAVDEYGQSARQTGGEVCECLRDQDSADRKRHPRPIATECHE